MSDLESFAACAAALAQAPLVVTMLLVVAGAIAVVAVLDRLEWPEVSTLVQRIHGRPRPRPIKPAIVDG